MLDELVKFMAEEVAMDGGLGCNPKRFIHHFTSPRSPLPSSPPHPDPNRYAAYIWTLLSSTPGFDVLVSGQPIVAPSEPVAGSAPDPVPEGAVRVDDRRARGPTPLVDIADTAEDEGGFGGVRILEEEGEDGVGRGEMLALMEKWGGRVIMRASTPKSLAAMTGSFVKVDRLTDPVMTCLEMVARARGKGCSTIELGKKMKVTQGTCFYLVKVLTHMGLVAKIKDIQSKAYTNVLVHRRYLLLNEQYLSRTSLSAEEIQNERSLGDDDPADTPIDYATGLPKFKPFGRVQLTIVSFVKARLMRLLRCNLWHHLIENRNLLVALGYAQKPSLRDRRKLQHIVGTMMRDGIIDSVLVPRTIKEGDKRPGHMPHRCLRLAEFRPGGEERFEEGGRVAPHDGMVAEGGEGEDGEEDGDDEDGDEDEEEEDDPRIGLSKTYSTEYWILESLRQSGANGMTYAEISRRLGGYDKRLIEAIVQRYEEPNACPAHLRHYSTWITMEMKRKERYIRVYTTNGYRDKCEAEDLAIPDDLPPRSRPEEEGGWNDLSNFKMVQHPDDREKIITTFPHGKPLKDFRTWMGKSEKGILEIKPRKRMGRPPKGFTKKDLAKAALKKAAKEAKLAETARAKAAKAAEKAEKAAKGAKGAKLAKVVKPLRPRSVVPDSQEEEDELQENAMDMDSSDAGGNQGENPASDDESSDGMAREDGRGRPRKWIKVVELDGSLSKRRKSTMYARHPELPATILYNPATNVIFNVPAEWSGTGPIPKPKDWDTAKGPKKLLVPSTGLPPPPPKGSVAHNKHTQTQKQKRKQDKMASPPAGQPETTNAAASGSKPPRKKQKLGKKDALGAQQTAQEALDARLALELVANAARAQAKHANARRATAFSAPVPASTTGSGPMDVDEVSTGRMPPTAAAAASTSTSARAGASSATGNQAGKKTSTSTGVAATTPARQVRITATRTDNSLAIKRKELLHVIDKIGGVVEWGTQLMKAHYEWAQNAKANGDSLQPKDIMQFDKRTISKALEPVVASGELKKTIVAVEVAGKTTLTLVSRPNADKKLLFQCIQDCKNYASRNYAPYHGEIAPDVPQFTRATVEAPPKIRQHTDEEALIALSTPIDELDSMTSDEARALFLRDWRLVPQSYGFIIGKYRRAQKIHGIIWGVLQQMARNQSLPIAYFSENIPVYLFCQCFSVPIWSDELAAFLSNPRNRNTPVFATSQSIQRVLRASQSAIRKKVKLLLQVLVDLGLLETLIFQTINGVVYTVNSDMERATHIRPLSLVPLFNLGGEEESAPLVTMFRLFSADDAAGYWYQFWQMSITTGDYNAKLVSNLHESMGHATAHQNSSGSFDPKLRADMRKPVRWITEYQMTKAQRRYLKAKLPSDPESSTDISLQLVEELAYRICAPEGVVDAHMRKLAAIAYRKMKQERAAKVKLLPAPPPVDKATVRAALAEKVRLRDEFLDKEWRGMLANICESINQTPTEDLHRAMKPLRMKWTRSRTTFSMPNLRVQVTNFYNRLANRPAPSTTVPSGHSNASLVPLLPPPRKGKKPAVPGTRTRTNWDTEAEELAIDGYIILFHRLKFLGLPANTKGAYDLLGTLFPDVDAVKVKQRSTKFRNASEQQSNFLDRLVLAWDKEYKKLRGTDELHDPRPDSMHHIILRDWVDVLRKHVKKGILWRSIGQVRPEDRLPLLPTSIEELEASFRTTIISEKMPQPAVDVLWDNHVADERKEQAVHGESYCLSKINANPRSYKPDLLRSTVKMIIGNPQWTYSHEKAQALLSGVKETVVQRKLSDMMREGVLVPENPENPLGASGRSWVFAAPYDAALAKPYSTQFLEEAENVAQAFGEDAFIDWPLISQAGEFAGALTLALTGQLDFEIDAAMCGCLNYTRNEYATKMMEDQDIELSIGVRLKNLTIEPDLTLHTPVLGQPRKPPAQPTGSDAADVALDVKAKAIIDAAGANGIAFSDLVNSLGVSSDQAAESVHRLSIPSETPVVVSAGYLLTPISGDTWTIKCKAEGEEERDIFPRQWLDIYGQINIERWNKIYGAVFGTIMRQPGINGRNLRNHLTGTLDILEIDDMLNHQLSEGRIVQISTANARNVALVGLATTDEEQYEHYFVKESSWEGVLREPELEVMEDI